MSKSITVTLNERFHTKTLTYWVVHQGRHYPIATAEYWEDQLADFTLYQIINEWRPDYIVLDEKSFYNMVDVNTIISENLNTTVKDCRTLQHSAPMLDIGFMALKSNVYNTVTAVAEDGIIYETLRQGISCNLTTKYLDSVIELPGRNVVDDPLASKLMPMVINHLQTNTVHAPRVLTSSIEVLFMIEYLQNLMSHYGVEE